MCRSAPSAMTKFVFVTGGVVSSLGKGIAAASLAAILESRGLKVTLIKLDPYINVDPGTMSPFQHGEVVDLFHFGADEARVMAEIEIGFGAVVRDEHFTMLERTHRARVHIDVGIQQDESDIEAARFKDRSERSGCDSLTQG